MKNKEFKKGDIITPLVEEDVDYKFSSDLKIKVSETDETGSGRIIIRGFILEGLIMRNGISKPDYKDSSYRFSVWEEDFKLKENKQILYPIY